MFRAILTNPFYIGRVDTVQAKRDGLWEPMDDVATATAIQSRLARYEPRQTMPVTEFPLRGLLDCGRCGAALFNSVTKRPKRRFTYYQCRSCRLLVPTAKTHAIFDAWLETLVPVPGFLALVRDRVVAAPGDDESRLAHERAGAQNALAEVEGNSTR